MITTPFYDLPVHDAPTPPSFERLTLLTKWAVDLSHYAVGFVAVVGPPDFAESYKYQIAFPHDNILVVTEHSIMGCAAEVNDDLIPKTDVSQDKVLFHVEQYMRKINRVPDWGTREFYRLKLLKRTTIELSGPNRSGDVPKHRKRLVIKDRDELIYGPLI